MAGDKAEQLLWRLQNGEMPASKHPKVVVVMIGTNGECPPLGQTMQRSAEHDSVQVLARSSVSACLHGYKNVGRRRGMLQGGLGFRALKRLSCLLPHHPTYRDFQKLE